MPFIIGLKVFINADDESIVKVLVAVSLTVCFELLLHDRRVEAIKIKQRNSFTVIGFGGG
jgi:hypothetical protein